jgi:hypothetical protein
MLGSFYPHADDIKFSLLDAPDGMSINNEGLITISDNAKLEDENSIIVQAVYQGAAYTAVLFIRRDTRRFPARYLGTITTLPSAASVFIITGPVQGQVRARQGDYVLAIANGPNWQAGRVYQWTGIAWEFRPPDNHADLYIRCFKDGLDVPELTKDMGWFGALFARLIVAQQAFIEELQAQHITLKNGGIIQSSNWDSNTRRGWLIDFDGNAYFFSGEIGGVKINAGSLQVNGKGYLPIGFIYFQLRGQPEPKELFDGVWENISSDYAGLFFRVEGGNAAPFGENQSQSIQAHAHTYINNRFGVIGQSGNYFNMSTITNQANENTGSTGSVETRPVNTTIRVWIRKS